MTGSLNSLDNEHCCYKCNKELRCRPYKYCANCLSMWVNSPARDLYTVYRLADNDEMCEKVCTMFERGEI
jgi:hypothetical protein